MKDRQPVAQTKLQIGAYALGSLVLVGIWFALKVSHFKALHYSSDLFSSLQSSRSWLDGYPFLFEFRYGDTLRYHTYFLTAAFAPATTWIGAKGLFLGHALVLWAVPFALLRQAILPLTRRWVLLSLAVLYWGPYGAWLFDDIRFGWHLEMLFFPLSLLFVAALKTKSTGATVGAGLLLCLVREDGPVLGCCLYLFSIVVKTSGFVHLPRMMLVRRVLPIAAGWVTAFLLAMDVLYSHRSGQEMRVIQSWNHFADLSLARQFFALSVNLGRAGLMLLPVGWLVWRGYGLRRLAWLVLTSLPLLVVGLAGSVLHGTNSWFGLSWGPRMAMLLGYAVGGLLLLVLDQPPVWVRSTGQFVRLGLLLLLCQWVGLGLARQYNGLAYDGRLVDQWTGSGEESFSQELYRIATRIPRRAFVATEYGFFAPFEWHRYGWLELGHWPNARVARPDFIVTTPASTMPFDWEQAPKDQYRVRTIGRLVVYQRVGFRYIPPEKPLF